MMKLTAHVQGRASVGHSEDVCRSGGRTCCPLAGLSELPRGAAVGKKPAQSARGWCPPPDMEVYVPLAGGAVDPWLSSVRALGKEEIARAETVS